MTRIHTTRFVFQPVQRVRPCEAVYYQITGAVHAGDVKFFTSESIPREPCGFLLPDLPLADFERMRDAAIR